MEKIRCPICKKTLLYAENGKIEIKCSKCSKIIKIIKENDRTETVLKK